MRAETQNIVGQIEKSLELLSQRMDRETAQHRLEEFNARVEDPNLWDDPEAAQKLMRDRQVLVDAMETYETIKQDLVGQCRNDRIGRNGRGRRSRARRRGGTGNSGC